MRPEATLEDYFIKQAEKHGFLQYKFLSGQTGVPDRVIIGHGKTIFVELKAADGVISQRQKFVIRAMRKHGATVFIPFNRNDIDEIFKTITKEITALD